MASYIVDPDSHDPKLYFEDGNVVLSARNGGNRTYFRLHKSILVQHSPEGFGNMFAMPPPPTIDMYDGAPLVEMPDDADDLRGPTRLAKKYQVDWIVKKVASQLEKRWPTTLHGWDEIAQEEEDAAFRSFVGHWDESDTDPTLDRRRFPEPASSILLARECEVSTIVPFAFFNLVVWPSVLPDSPDDAYLLTACRNVPRMDLICPEDRLRIFEARELIARWFGAHRITAWKPCGSDMACQKRTSDTWFNLAVNIGHTGDFLRYSRYTEVQLNDSHCRDICPQCKKKLQDQIRKLRWDFVGELSAFLQLDDDA